MNKRRITLKYIPILKYIMVSDKRTKNKIKARTRKYSQSEKTIVLFG